MEAAANMSSIVAKPHYLLGKGEEDDGLSSNYSNGLVDGVRSKSMADFEQDNLNLNNKKSKKRRRCNC